MKWYSKDGKMMINLERITWFKYYDRDDLAKFENPFGGGAPHYNNEVKQYGQFILLREGNQEYTFRGDEALEIYKILSNRRQVL